MYVCVRVGVGDAQTFDQDIQSVVRPVKLDRSIIQELIAMHLYRAGQFEVAQSFCEAVRLQLPAEALRPFVAMNAIVKALTAGDLRPAQQYVIFVSQPRDPCVSLNVCVGGL